MNEFYLPKKSTSTQYLIEKAIYEDIYQYRESDSITLKMLQSIILNQNKHLFVQVLSKKILTQQEIIYLLEIVCREGDTYFDFFEVLYKKCIIKEEILFSLVEKCLLYNGLKILKRLFLEHSCNIKKYLTKEVIESCLEKNPEVTLIQLLINYIDKSLIFTTIFLQEIINNDNIKLFIIYTKNQQYNDWNSYLDMAIMKNAYDIITYILTEITTYHIKKDSINYSDFFDYLMTENLTKVITFLDKVDKIALLGISNLEKLLLSFNNHEDFQLLLFKYDLINIHFNDEFLQNKINKFVLNKKLQTKLTKKSIKEIKKI